MPEQSCPGSDRLRDFALGLGEAAQFDNLEQHVAGCADCQKQLEQLDGSADQLVDHLSRLRSSGLTKENGNEPWHEAVEAIIAHPHAANSRIAADAGRDLARRLLEGVVRLDRFELRSELGVGSFGYVFRAWDPRLQRVVALKVQRAGSLASKEEAERFGREARSAAQLKHPAIVSVYESGQTQDNVWFLVCEFVDGVTLEERLKDGSLAPQQAATIAWQLADALQYAHEQGVVHRDVKPSNIILDRHERAHVMDFGLAKRAAGELTMTSDGRVLGTPAYMSPEQAAGTSHEVDARSDIYSLGVVLYEMLTGERPFHGNRRLLLLQVVEDDPRPPRAVKPGLPRNLEVICLKAMNKAPARRYPTAREMADDLRRFQQRQPILARPTGTVERTMRWCHRYPLAVSLLVAVLVGSVSGLWYLSSLAEFFVRQTALESARLETHMLDEVWRYYSEEISDIDPAKTTVAITENYRNVHPSLPLPATFAIDLGERISRRSPGMEVRVYSRYPWPSRKEGGPQSEFDVAALEWLEARAKPNDEVPAEYARFVDDGRRKLLYYTARHMEKSCIGCHNHPDGRSPKKDWKEGDVVGVLKIVRPLEREIDNTQAGLRSAFLLMGTVSTLLLVVSVVTVAAESTEGGFVMSSQSASGQRAGSGSTSRSLLADARLADPAAWERVVRLYAPLVASWCGRWGVARQDVPDVLQDVFSAVAGHLDRFHKERPSDTFRGWLFSIARNKVWDHFRRRAGEPMAAGGTEATLRIQQIAEDVPREESAKWTDEVLLDDLLRTALESIQGEFHENTWLAFWGVVVEGRATADVAADLEMKPGAVRVAKSRVLLRLRRELGDAP